MSGWQVLIDVLHDFGDPVYRQDTHFSCPRDGEPLTIGPDGEPHCRFDGYRPGGAQDPGYGVVTQ